MPGSRTGFLKYSVSGSETWKFFFKVKQRKMNEVTSKPTRPILRYSSVVNMEKGQFTNFKNS